MFRSHGMCVSRVLLDLAKAEGAHRRGAASCVEVLACVCHVCCLIYRSRKSWSCFVFISRRMFVKCVLLSQRKQKESKEEELLYA